MASRGMGTRDAQKMMTERGAGVKMTPERSVDPHAPALEPGPHAKNGSGSAVATETGEIMVERGNGALRNTLFC